MLALAGVPSAIHYPTPLHHQPAYAAYAPTDSCRVSVNASESVLSLPMCADLTANDQRRVIDSVVFALRKSAPRL